MENAINLDAGTFAGLVKPNKNIILNGLYSRWEMAIRGERRAYLDAMNATDTKTVDERSGIAQRYRAEYRILEDIMRQMLTENSKGEFVEAKWDDAYDSLKATRYAIEEQAQNAYARALQAKKDAELKEEYLAGFDAWKEAQGL